MLKLNSYNAIKDKQNMCAVFAMEIHKNHQVLLTHTKSESLSMSFESDVFVWFVSLLLTTCSLY